jgi:multidrug resistance protein, MATE family
VRVSNELGAGKPEAAKFAIVVNTLVSAMIGLVCSAAVVASKNQFPFIFTNKPDVIKETSKLGYLLGTTIFVSSIQPVLQGMFP